MIEMFLVVFQEIDDNELEELAYMSLEDNDDLDYKDDGYIELVLRIMGLMCDGQNTILQDYLREQPDNIKSVNLVAETSRFLALLYSSINNQTIGLITELFNTLVEFTSVSQHTNLLASHSEITRYITDNEVCGSVR